MSKLLYITILAFSSTTVFGQWTRNEPPDLAGIIGATIAPMRYCTAYGSDWEINGRIAGNLYLGFNVAQLVGETSEHYGLTYADGDKFYLDATTVGLNLDYMLYHDDKSYLQLCFIAGLENISIGGKQSSYYTGFNSPFIPSMTFHKTILYNYYASLRPAISFMTHKFGAMVSYNFLADGLTNFGKKQDFESLQLTVYFNIGKNTSHCGKTYRYY